VVAILPDRPEIYRRLGGPTPGCGLTWSEEVFLSRVFFFDLGRAPDVEPQFTEFQTQGLTGDSQQARRLLDIPLRMLEDEAQQEPVDLAMRFSVQVASVRP
jgi:hypothetical protein